MAYVSFDSQLKAILHYTVIQRMNAITNTVKHCQSISVVIDHNLTMQ